MALYDVSVCITSYFHEPYIRQALESVLAQKTSFSYEICVSDDCSGDGTYAILQEYAARCPDIRIQRHEENVGLTANVYSVRCMAQGRYIVHLSGDDYYIDENKLQKQYDFLESHQEFFAVCTRIEVRVEDSAKRHELYPPMKYCGREFTLDMFLKGINYPLNGIMFRNCFLDEKEREYFSLMPRASHYVDDVTDCILIAKKGRVYILPDICTAYRIRKTVTGAHNFTAQNRGLSGYLKHLENLNNLYAEFGGELDLFHRYREVIYMAWAPSFYFGKHREYRQALQTVPEEYRKRFLYLRSIFSALADLPRRTFDHLTR